jgi:cyanophycinase
MQFPKFLHKNTTGAGRGHLVLIGGSEDRKDNRVILHKLLEVSRAKRIAIIPAASTIQQDLDRNYQEAFTAMGIPEVHPLIIEDRAQAEAKAAVQVIRKANLVFFTGGSQARLLDTMEGTALAAEVLRKFRSGATVAGTSAGAAAAGEWTIFYGDDCGTAKDACQHRRGFGFLEGVVVDTHFMERNRQYRLAQFLASGKCRHGIGIAEDTAIVVSPDRTMEVVGSGVVTVMDAGPISSTNYGTAAPGEPVSVNGIAVGFLPAGTKFDLDRWEIQS